MFSHVNIHVTIFLTYVLIMLMLVLWSYVRIQLLFTNVFYFLKMQEIAKKESSIKAWSVIFRIVVGIESFPCFIFIYTHVLEFIF